MGWAWDRSKSAGQVHAKAWRVLYGEIVELFKDNFVVILTWHDFNLIFALDVKLLLLLVATIIRQVIATCQSAKLFHLITLTILR